MKFTPPGLPPLRKAREKAKRITCLRELAPAPTVRYVKTRICPGFTRWLPGSSLSSAASKVEYTVPQRGNSDGKGGSDVFGPGVPPLPFQTFGYPDPGRSAPQKLSFISAVRPLTYIWALADTDQEVFNNGPSKPGWYASLPPKLLHGSVRNYMFLDGHTATRRAVAGYW